MKMKDEIIEYDFAAPKEQPNHKKPKKKPFDYYPRGRVDINSRGEAVIYMNTNIGKEIIPKIKTAFGITIEPIIKYDRSEHYKCYLDR